MENQWLRMNKSKIEAMQHELTVLAYKNENPGVPVTEFRGLLGAAVVEIKKLQQIIDELTAKLPKEK